MRTHGSEEFDAVSLIDSLNRERVKYLLIGRQAVVLYGAPLLSFDYDFWVSPGDREKVYECLYAFGLQSRYKPSDKRPIDIFTDDEGNKVDVFFASVMENRDRNIFVDFETVYQRSARKADPDTDFFVQVPAVDDLISLKQLGEMRPKDAEDIEYLEKIKSAGQHE